MALVKVGEKALEAVKAVGSTKLIQHRPPKRKVLDEDAYITDLEKIIQRDFFPDLEKLHSQVEYMEARDNNDVTKMREIAIKLQASTVHRQQTNTPAQFEQAVTPATFETPDMNAKSLQTPTADRGGVDRLISNPEPSTAKDIQETEKDKGNSNTDLSLDRYLSNYTSEDNASFGDLMEAASDRRREKNAWLYEEEKRLKKESEHLLMLNGPESLAIEGSPAAGLNSWTYKAKNSLMYVPDGVEDTAEEKINKKSKEREILYENTRFLCNPHRNSAQLEAKARAIASKAAMKQGKIGHDGKEILESETPRVKGYGFVSAPSPVPGVHDSPLMTWGEIESTPMRLDGSQTPVTKTLGFKMPKNPRREELARSLVEKNAKQHRAKKEAALKNVTQRFTSPSFGSLNSVERIRTLSPAAQRLVNRRTKGTDKALRASYTPSPQSARKSDKTPILQATPKGTPVQTPVATCSGTSGGTPGNFNIASSNSSLTDNLLDLPRRDSRKKATDFF
ncbi:splicing factor ESS-2 homolog [Anneissia japonica]|uniref:splicing factor ESS-2 homolog n=1 Tax=Anneissia japonica TaxID=1529436 RepID=UPI0014255287|nr:splicing factor ESS-2 homolog [Anneissia japonica]XP_033115763.1 splicing factor ESS-2 homolog [Anneissia japonica]XP_033115774.1 splicing factor ESS-2 homolog [Anneissia japonica]